MLFAVEPQSPSDPESARTSPGAIASRPVRPMAKTLEDALIEAPYLIELSLIRIDWYKGLFVMAS